jgi:cytochrome c oxidase cbb3-type subunit 3
MKKSWIPLFAVFFGALCSCDVRPSEAAPTGAVTQLHVPVGPVPGAENPPQLPVNPYSSDKVALVQGRKLFVDMNCSGCHGDHGGGGMGPSLRDETWLYGGEDARVFSSIAEGRSNGMPSWGSKLPENQVWQLALYVKSLRTPQEPEPPQ